MYLFAEPVLYAFSMSCNHVDLVMAQLKACVRGYGPVPGHCLQEISRKAVLSYLFEFRLGKFQGK